MNSLITKILILVLHILKYLSFDNSTRILSLSSRNSILKRIRLKNLKKRDGIPVFRKICPQSDQFLSELVEGMARIRRGIQAFHVEK